MPRTQGKEGNPAYKISVNIHHQGTRLGLMRVPDANHMTESAM